MKPTILPLPNGRMDFSGESLPLLHTFGVSRGDFPQALLDVFAQRAGITLTDDPPALLRLYRNAKFPPEAYRLRVTFSHGIQIETGDEQGLCWALVTLLSLIGEEQITCCDITDQPQYNHRGILLDCVRNFFPVETVKEFIEAVSLAKINRFHWHLTDDQGWRIESKRFPALHGQCAPYYYTQAQIRDVVAFAAARGVEIIPEVELPGHTTAILAAYPQLSCTGEPVPLGTAPGIYSLLLCPGKDEVFDLLFPLLEEIAELFPSPLFHLGGDEAPKGIWRSCPHCQSRIEKEGLASEEELQGWFTARLAAHLRTFGKRVICWNESLLSDDLPENVGDLTIQYWAEMHKFGPTYRFWQSGGDVIFSDWFNAYLDQPHGTIPMETVYSYVPGFPPLLDKAPRAMGLEACVWTEFLASPQRLAEAAFPRAYALAEAAWTQPSRRDYADFLERLTPWLERHPGPGFTPPPQADPDFRERYRQRTEFMRRQLNAPKPEHNGGLGGAMAPVWLMRWLRANLR